MEDTGIGMLKKLLKCTKVIGSPMKKHKSEIGANIWKMPKYLVANSTYK